MLNFSSYYELSALSYRAPPSHRGFSPKSLIIDFRVSCYSDGGFSDFSWGAVLWCMIIHSGTEYD